MTFRVNVGKHDDVLLPTYPCGQHGPRSTLDHGERYAIHVIVVDYQKHCKRCRACEPAPRDTLNWESLPPVSELLGRTLASTSPRVVRFFQALTNQASLQKG